MLARVLVELSLMKRKKTRSNSGLKIDLKIPKARPKNKFWSRFFLLSFILELSCGDPIWCELG